LNSTSWVNTPALFKFLGTKGFTPSPEFFNTDDYRDNRSSNPNAQLNYLRLRENTNDMINQNGLVKMRWSDFMLQIHNIQPGDLVFYKDTSGQWSHVAMVSEAWVDQTNYLWNGTGIPEPRIVEHSGPITAPVRPFRTMGDSEDEFLMSVQILFAP
jgi:hypothetical protein